MPIPVLKSGPRIWQILGGAMYSTRPLLPITVRELFQNSRDACRELPRAPEIILTLETDDFRQGRLICEDNGCGMDENTLLTKFFVLGESQKAAGSTGGWGIAKAVIVGGACRWRLWTQDLFVSYEHLEECRPIEHVPTPRTGTRIELDYDLLPAGDPRRGIIGLDIHGFEAGLSLLLHSDTPCTVRLVLQGHLSTWSTPGLVATQENYLCGQSSPKTIWGLYEFDAVKNAEIVNLTSSQHVEIESPRYVFYRLNGLAQFRAYGSTEHQDVFVLDIKTTAQPGEPDYPFTPSREGVIQEIASKANAALSPHERNPITSATRRRDKKKPADVVYYDGKSMGQKTRKANTTQEDRLAAARLVMSENDAALSHASIAQRIKVQGRFAQNPTGVHLMFKGLSKTRRDVLSPINQRFLLAWGNVLELVMDTNCIWEEFGIGFIFHDSEAAERHVDAHGVFYLVNPDLSELRMTQPVETLWKLYFLAAHEVTHQSCPDHTEIFAVRMGQLLDAALSHFLRKLPKLKAILQGHSPLPEMTVNYQLPLLEVFEEKQ